MSVSSDLVSFVHPTHEACDGAQTIYSIESISNRRGAMFVAAHRHVSVQARQRMEARTTCASQEALRGTTAPYGTQSMSV